MMTQAALSTQLQSMVPSMVEADAITAFANAWGSYFNSSLCGAIPYTGDPGNVAKNAMKAAMVGLSVTGQALTKIQAGIVSYWAAIAAAPATFYATIVVVVPPPGITGIAAALAPVCLANTTGSLSLAASADAIATVLHSANLGGTGAIPPAPPTVIT